MSLTLNMVGGGSGGGEFLPTDAILRVQAPSGSTVTITKGSVTKTDLGHENADDSSIYDYYFVIHASQFDSINSWTVMATLGANTASENIIIDSANEYNIILSYHVPPEYQEVEYLESTGTQYINTLMMGINGCEADFQYDYASGGGETLLGARDNGGASFGFGKSSSNTRLFSLPGTIYSDTVVTDRHYLKQGIIIGGKIELDGIETGTLSGAYTSNTNMRFFCEWVAGTGLTNYARAKLFYLALYKDQDMVFEFYPCYRKSDSVAGMYDTVSETFFTNAGTGTFIVGADV